MTLGEKIRYLREVEGSLRGLNRPLTQQELMKGIQAETGKTISQSYLSQIERGKRPHMTQSSRTLLARFFKVHPGFLVDDPEGYHTELVSRPAHHRRSARCLAAARLGAFRQRPGGERRPDQGGA